eukprot:TRINITY_DN1562_c0_g1_i11.p1 TRINITY_DN1562_c0_g1~~TRINITY_DN1562_c0_g1_i11.p1  ORF type:complete len:348 (-),score=60.80 TRINITY_DN1562_c0_g1_i11:69-1112(-)
MPRLVNRFCEMCGIRLSAGVLDKFETTILDKFASCKADVAHDYRSYWTFVIADVQSLSPTIKHMNVIDFAEGSAHLLRAREGKEKDTKHHYGAREMRALFHLSQQWLSQGQRMGTDFPESFLHLGEAFYQEAMTLPVHDRTATLLLDKADRNFQSCIKRDRESISARFGCILVQFALLKYKPGKLTLEDLPPIDIQQYLSQIEEISSSLSWAPTQRASVKLQCGLLFSAVQQQCNVYVAEVQAWKADPGGSPAHPTARLEYTDENETAMLVACAFVKELETFVVQQQQQRQPQPQPQPQHPEQQQGTAPVPTIALRSDFVEALNLKQWLYLRTKVEGELKRRLPLLL